MEKHTLSDWIEAGLSRIGFGRIYWKNLKIKKIEKKMNMNFGGHILQDELGFASELGNDYSPSPDWIVSILNNRIKGNESIMDLGCGKGYAMFLMSKYSFKNIYGIELSKSLYEIAKLNIQKLKDDRLFVWNKDATSLDSDDDLWSKLGECQYIYIYNSFPHGVMKKIVELLEKKVMEIDWRTSIFYVSPSPECLTILENSEEFELVNHYFETMANGGVYEFKSKIEDEREK